MLAGSSAMRELGALSLTCCTKTFSFLSSYRRTLLFALIATLCLVLLFFANQDTILHYFAVGPVDWPSTEEMSARQDELFRRQEASIDRLCSSDKTTVTTDKRVSSFCYVAKLSRKIQPKPTRNVILGMWDFRKPVKKKRRTKGTGGGKSNKKTKQQEGEGATSPEPVNPFGTLMRFCASLYQTGSPAVVVLFTPTLLNTNNNNNDNKNGEEEDSESRHNHDALVKQQMHEFNSRCPNVHWIKYTKTLLNQKELYTFSSLRFSLYNLFLQRFGSLFDHVMTSDISDVAFQRDPFVFAAQEFSSSNNNNNNKDNGGGGGVPAKQKSMIIALENSTFAQNRINRYWISICFGEKALAPLLSRPVSCSGTTIGTIDTMRAYVREMDSQSRKSFWCSTQGSDQGVHNYLMWAMPSLRDQWIGHRVTTGGILTLDQYKVFRWKRKPSARAVSASSPTELDPEDYDLVNENGRVVPIIHQIPRCVHFGERFLLFTRKDDEEQEEKLSRWGGDVVLADGRQWKEAPDGLFGCEAVLNKKFF